MQTAVGWLIKHDLVSGTAPSPARRPRGRLSQTCVSGGAPPPNIDKNPQHLSTDRKPLTEASNSTGYAASAPSRRPVRGGLLMITHAIAVGVNDRRPRVSAMSGWSDKYAGFSPAKASFHEDDTSFYL